MTDAKSWIEERRAMVGFDGGTSDQTTKAGLPRALDALSKVLERHQPIDGLAYDSPPQECNVCADDRGPRPWPCPTVQAIEGAINEVGSTTD